MDNRNIKVKKWLLAVLLVGIAACMLLGGCASMDSCISGCALLRSWWTPELGLTGDQDTPMPVIEGSIGAEEMTLALAEHYEPIAQVVRLANEVTHMFTLEHELVTLENDHYLHSAIYCADGGSIDLPRIYIPYCGTTEFPGWSVPEAIDGAQMTAAWMELTANNVEVDLTRLGEKMTAASLYELYLDYYRDLSDLEIDVSRFVDTITFDQPCKEAMELSICDGEYEYELEELDVMTLQNVSVELLSALYNDACGKGSTGFTEAELLECINDFVSFSPVKGEEWEKDRELFRLVIDDRLDELGKQGKLPELTRMAAAASLVRLYEVMYGEIDGPEDMESWLDDTSDVNCVKANYEGFMGIFPSGNLFAPEYVPTRNEMPGFVDNLLHTSCLGNVDNIWDQKVTYADVVLSLAAIDTCVRRAGITDYAVRTVDNSCDYEWYYTQHNTGWYSSVNCMPTITMMATKWYDRYTTVTIQEMRDRYLPDYSGGWYTWQVAECLGQNGVPNELVDISESLLPYLNDGKIILSQMTEASDEDSGHCFVIYGYWKRGDTIKYLVHDPDVYDGIDKYGKRPGKAMVMDGHYCDWIMERIAFSFIVVG